MAATGPVVADSVVLDWATDPLNLYINQVGLCHICKQRGQTIAFCSLCGHWWCTPCNDALAKRAVAAVAEWMGRARPGCCGPDGVSMVWSDSLLMVKWGKMTLPPVSTARKILPGVMVARESTVSQTLLYSVWGLRLGSRFEIALTRAWRRTVAG